MGKSLSAGCPSYFSAFSIFSSLFACLFSLILQSREIRGFEDPPLARGGYGLFRVGVALDGAGCAGAGGVAMALVEQGFVHGC